MTMIALGIILMALSPLVVAAGFFFDAYHDFEYFDRIFKPVIGLAGLLLTVGFAVGMVGALT